MSELFIFASLLVTPGGYCRGATLYREMSNMGGFQAYLLCMASRGNLLECGALSEFEWIRTLYRRVLELDGLIVAIRRQTPLLLQQNNYDNRERLSSVTSFVYTYNICYIQKLNVCTCMHQRHRTHNQARARAHVHTHTQTHKHTHTQTHTNTHTNTQIYAISINLNLF